MYILTISVAAEMHPRPRTIPNMDTPGPARDAAMALANRPPPYQVGPRPTRPNCPFLTGSINRLPPTIKQTDAVQPMRASRKPVHIESVV